jgi:Protein of unknown function (DUF2934)
MKTNLPTHDEIAQRARQIWQDKGSPGGRDDEIWLEAERDLIAGSGGSDPSAASGEQAHSTPESKGASALADRVKKETAAESVVEYHISPAAPDDSAVKAALQKKDARAPQVPTKTAPKAKPPETGKPLWSTPHSS